MNMAVSFLMPLIVLGAQVVGQAPDTSVKDLSKVKLAAQIQIDIDRDKCVRAVVELSAVIAAVGTVLKKDTSYKLSDVTNLGVSSVHGNIVRLGDLCRVDVLFDPPPPEQTKGQKRAK
jgi:hypothetical protein